ncbi:MULTISPECIES: iron chaperone [Rhodococcus]|uniref:iron chaperone n=1 Tax=Rhodococcus TaxID=1827 RepID=UPI001AE2609B|nr:MULTISPECIES: DUF1801 domain-containing protein [Rhodococcus]MBP1158103.1 uncharacterized protein YdhG (YjbR/CyaY superfamily) [Rhodococcus sp. PvR099]MCZ4554295.1 DUF1801 domain-containing protein [Rhodococcus maanshanensis]
MAELTDYLATLDEPERSLLDGIRVRVLELAPDATEGVSYGMPALRYRDKPLLAVRAAATHLSVFPFSAAVVEAVAPELGGYSLSKGTIRFTADRPLPPQVLTRIIALRREEIDAAR